ncbi:hypothetical protein L6164_033429 [Bauhinia variegata]|uniref:Uncharacterized protein n=1 Tax=Bauhinia variegata TaxID=167791 RepID=A0ACB9KRM8_BAUVA|nr:hypothetical protein L6164_033429 [Bauhinia variegata]
MEGEDEGSSCSAGVCSSVEWGRKLTRDDGGDKEGDFEGSDVLTVVTTNTSNTWVMDSGASYHMTFNKNWFHSFKEWKGSVRLGDDKVLPVKGSGLLHIKMHDGIVKTFDAWYVPDLRKNLISLGTLDNQGHKFAGGDGQIKVLKGAFLVIKGKCQHGIYTLLGNSVMGSVAVSSSSNQGNDCTKLWHRKLGHMSEQGLTILAKKGLLDGAEILRFVLWASNVWVYFLKSKDKVFGWFKEWKTMVEKRTGKQVKTLRTNNGLEFYNAPFDEFCKKEVNTASYLVNRSPFTVIDCKTPQEVWYGTPSDYSSLRIFGCPAYAHVNDGKVEPRAIKCIFLGYVVGVKGYRLWCTEKDRTPRFIISRDVTFDESTVCGQKKELGDLAGKTDYGASQKVEFEVEVEAPNGMLENPTT